MANGRCRLHGGLCTGPRDTTAQRLLIDRIRLAGGKRHKHTRLLNVMDDLVKTLPAGPVDKPVEQWSVMQVMNDATRLAVMRLHEMLRRPIKDDGDPKEARRAELARNLLKDAVRLQVAALQQQGIDRLVEFEAAEKAYEKELLTRPKEKPSRAAGRDQDRSNTGK